MMAEREAKIGGNAVGNVVVAGDRNRVRATLRVGDVALPDPAGVDIVAVLASIRACLRQAGGADAGKAERALDDAEDEAKREQPDRDEVGRALNRAVEYAKKGAAFAEQVGTLAPHLGQAVAWLGAGWHHLLGATGAAP